MSPEHRVGTSGTENTIRDMDILRQALGDPTLNFLGYSYGTLPRHAATPSSSRTGSADSSSTAPSTPASTPCRSRCGQSGGFQVAMARFAQDCVTHVDLPDAHIRHRRSCGGVNALLARTRRRVRCAQSGTTRPRSGRGPRGDVLLDVLAADLALAATRPAAGRSAATARGLQAIADYANERTGPNTYATNMASAFPAIACWDVPAPPGATGLRAAARQWSRGVPVPDMARAMAWGNGVCSQWFGHTTRIPAPAASTTTSPILVVGTTYDPATPYAWAVALSRQLTTSTLLTYRGDGHTAYGSGSRCIDRAVDAYLLDGTMPAPGTVCR